MAGRHPNPKLAKIHRTYTVEEAAALCGVHRNTVRQWIKRGLPCLDDDRPTLILGEQLAAFLRVMRTRNKRPCQPGLIFCMRCREPRAPAQQQALYSPLTATQGNLIGICPVCSSRMYRRISVSKLLADGGPLRIAMPQAQEHIDENPQLSVNSDFKQEPSNHENAQRPQ